ncbi:hypothetical protein AU377_14395 [Sporosarcina sp. HYO08]|nr:hypothetical protein AU377_14395 [Sporosarcina sp. HYO08]
MRKVYSIAFLISHKQFEYQFNVLPAMGYRCIGIDWRGFGNSDKPMSGYTFNRLADDIRTVVGTLQLNNVQLNGARSYNNGVYFNGVGIFNLTSRLDIWLN